MKKGTKESDQNCKVLRWEDFLEGVYMHREFSRA